MKRLVSILSVLFFILLFLLSCSDTSNSDSEISQSDKDMYTGYAIIDSIAQIYNINFAGKPVGSINTNTTCPIGGNVVITGSTGYSQNNGITTVDLSFVMTDCKTQKHTENNIDISTSLTGTITWKGSFDSSRDYDATNYQSESLKIQASIKVPNHKETIIDETCKFAATITNKTVSGSICSRSFSY